MGRSLKKGPYIDFRLEKKVTAMDDTGKKTVSQDLVTQINDFSGFRRHTFAVHNGNKFIPVYVTENMVGIN